MALLAEQNLSQQQQCLQAANAQQGDAANLKSGSSALRYVAIPLSLIPLC